MALCAFFIESSWKSVILLPCMVTAATLCSVVVVQVALFKVLLLYVSQEIFKQIHIVQMGGSRSYLFDLENLHRDIKCICA